VEHNHASLIEAVVERTIRQCVWAHVERLNDLAARAALYGDEGRRMTFQVLVNALGPDGARAFGREIHSAAYQRLQEPLNRRTGGTGCHPVLLVLDEAARFCRAVAARIRRDDARPRH
jgi:hypothetical protein